MTVLPKDSRTVVRWNRRSFRFGVPGDYLFDTGLLKRVIERRENAVIRSPTGSGKSWAAIDYLKGRIPFVFVADTKVLADDLSHLHGVPAFYKGRKAPDCGHSFITIPNHAPGFSDRNIVLVVDEWHSLALERGFRRYVMEELANSFGRWRQVIGISATPVFGPPGFKRYFFDYIPEHRDVHLVTGQPDYLRKRLISRLVRQTEPLHWVTLLSTKTTLAGLIDDLLRRGLRKHEILVLNSSTRDSKRCAQLVEENRIPDGVRVVFSTYRQGFSINEGAFEIHVYSSPKSLSAVDMVQVMGRFRRPHALQRAWLYATLENDESEFNPEECQKQWRRRAQNRKDYYLRELGIQTPTPGQKRIIYLAETNRRPVKGSKEKYLLDPHLNPNELTLAYQVHTEHTDWLYKHPHHLEAGLLDHDLRIIPTPVPQSEEDARLLAEKYGLGPACREKLEEVLSILPLERLEVLLGSRSTVTPPVVGAIRTKAMVHLDGSQASRIRRALMAHLKVGKKMAVDVFIQQVIKASEALPSGDGKVLLGFKSEVRSVNQFIYVRRARLVEVVSYDPLAYYEVN